ncbi:hypothetical protein GTY65_12530 [Streptomyces sp. SID8379]|uniref:hypothetical protein n=1 Tax=unclassified Streptomyces TaxID=2593676 RepID=UPI001319BB56|nr:MULTISPECIES: hypothetical protein [unclassified Streptomyces]MYW64886.1 hypothetical protein [Streptomyces sp. SID8379]
MPDDDESTGKAPPEPTTDYACAGDRHFVDASYLHNDGRLLTADHLFGLAVECLMKGLLLRFGAGYGVSMMKNPTTEDTRPWWDDPAAGTRKPLGHWHQVHPALTVIARGRSASALTQAVERLSADFEKWTVSDRYTDGTHLDPPLMIRRKESAALAHDLHLHAQFTGKLP